MLVRRRKATRSSAQNRALWGVAYKALREQTGNEAPELHKYFCGEYFGWVVGEVFGMAKKDPRRTTTHDDDGRRDTISKAEFADFYAFIQQRAAENGFDVPDPDPYMESDAA